MIFNRDWLERRAVPLPGGRYRVRPGGRWGSVYEIDRLTKDRLVRLDMAAGWAGVALMTGGVFARSRLLPELENGFWWALLVFLVSTLAGLYFVIIRHLLRGAGKMPGNTWREPETFGVPAMRWPRWLSYVFTGLCAVLVVVISSALLILASSGEPVPVEVLVAPPLFVFAAFYFWKLRRRA